MSDQFVGEIRPFGFNFAPVGWALCAGQILPISQNTALFSLLGTQYGGNGTSTFALPNLQGIVPNGQGQGPGLSDYVIGQTGGEQNVTLLITEMPAHTHTLPASAGEAGGASTPSPSVYLGAVGSRIEPKPVYLTPAEASPLVPMLSTAVGVAGGSQPHNNMAPYLTINYCIALQGIYPARS